jgi:putative ABC transport system permease protein
VAVSLVVVLTAGLLARSYVALAGEDRGMETSGLLTFGLTLPAGNYPEAERVHEEMEALLERVRALPGVAGAAAGNRLPFADGYGQWDFQLDDRPPRADGEQAWNAAVHIVGPRYFETLGIPLTRGRAIRAEDGPETPWVGVVSEHFARTFWPGEDPLGKRWGYAQGEDSVTWITVVGVAEDPRLTELDEDPYPQVWIPASQSGRSGYGWPRTLRVAVRTGIEPAALAPAVRRAVAEFDPDLPVYALATMNDVVAETLARPRLTAGLLGLFALLALLLAAVGIYGVVSYSVAGRTREIGVRLALGASRRAVLGMVVREGIRPVALGVALGLLLAWAGTRLLDALLFGVEPTDPLTFGVISGLLVAVGLVASLLPARRATRVQPTEALRAE